MCFSQTSVKELEIKLGFLSATNTFISSILGAREITFASRMLGPNSYFEFNFCSVDDLDMLI